MHAAKNYKSLSFTLRLPFFHGIFIFFEDKFSLYFFLFFVFSSPFHDFGMIFLPLAWSPYIWHAFRIVCLPSTWSPWSPYLCHGLHAFNMAIMSKAWPPCKRWQSAMVTMFLAWWPIGHVFMPLSWSPSVQYGHNASGMMIKPSVLLTTLFNALAVFF